LDKKKVISVSESLPNPAFLRAYTFIAVLLTVYGADIKPANFKIASSGMGDSTDMISKAELDDQRKSR
jgi:hypothetical protein